MSATLHARCATPADAPMIAHIYNEGIADRVATFETSPRAAEDVQAWFDGTHPIVVVEDQQAIVAFASTSTYRPRCATPASPSSRCMSPAGSAATARAGWRWMR